MTRSKRNISRSKRAKNLRTYFGKQKAEIKTPLTPCKDLQDSSEDTFNRLLEESRLDASPSHQPSCSKVQEDKGEESPPPLIIERVSDISIAVEDLHVEGRRIVNIQHVLSEMERLARHPRNCTTGRFKLKKEYRGGLYSKWTFHCENCSREESITSGPENDGEDVNDALAWGSMAIGIGYSQVEELFSVLDVPMMSRNKFNHHENRVGETWEETLVMKMKQNAELEKQIAIEKGNIHNGVPFITVIGDGGWAKRSYGHGMNSLSGVGVLIGAETKKLLFLGVRNKFCFACANPRKKKEHLCFKNYKGPSTGMESSIIVEGFQRSKDDYGLLYLNYIGDGDSSVYARIQEGCRYGRHVRKIECANHVTRGLNDNLRKLGANTSYPLVSRQLLNNPAPNEKISRLERLVKGVRTAINEAGITKSSQDIRNLRWDIQNAIYHVFGNHSNCRNFCQRKNNNEMDLTQELDEEFLNKMRSIINRVESKAESLVFNETTNFAERYMSCVTKLSGGKRVNYSTGGSFQRRCLGAGLLHTSGPRWHLSPWKSFKNKSPGKIFREIILRRERKNMKRKLLFGGRETTVAKRKRQAGGHDAEYGPLTVEPDIEESVMKEKRQKLMEELLEDVIDGGKKLSEETKGQHKNQLWREKRMNRLTASKFGDVAKRLAHTSCHNMVKSILFPKKLQTDAICFGRDNEDRAIKLYEEKKEITVEKCGLFVDQEHPCLGASPDGLIDDDGLIEIKCLHSVKENDLAEEVRIKKKGICLEMDQEGILRLKRTHKYYYQIQGQLNICQKEWCDFVIYTRKGELFIERIIRDRTFWQQKVLPKLLQFYHECMLPEIIDSRIVRGMRVREPEFIIEAQDKRGQKAESHK